LSSGALTQLSNTGTSAILRGAAIGYGTTPNVYFVGDNGAGVVLQPNGNIGMHNLTGSTLPLYSISENQGSKGDDLYVGGAISGGHGFAESWDGGGGLTPQMSSGGNIAGNVNAMQCGMAYHYAAGDAGAIVRRSSASNNSNMWMAVGTGVTTKNLRGLWESGDNFIIAVGDMGTILQSDGMTWTAATSQTMVNLHAVWGTGPTNIYAVGDSGTVMHYTP
jgi:hypothetical protein